MYDLTGLSEMLKELPIGQCADVPYSVFEDLFPPGYPDQGALARAHDFARGHGCIIVSGRRRRSRCSPYDRDGHRLFFGPDGSAVWGPLVERYLAEQHANAQ